MPAHGLGVDADLQMTPVNGATLEEAQENARTGLEMRVEDMKEQGLSMAESSTRAISFDVAA